MWMGLSSFILYSLRINIPIFALCNCQSKFEEDWIDRCCVQVVQEYERAVIMRLGRILSGRN